MTTPRSTNHRLPLQSENREDLIVGRALSLPFRFRPLPLGRESPAIRTAGGPGRAAERRLRGQAGADEVGELAQGDLAIAQLGPLLGRSHGDHPSDEFGAKPGEEKRALAVGEHCGVGHVPEELDPAVRRVDVLTTRPGRTGEPPPEFRRGNDERRRHLQIHAPSVARCGRTRDTARPARPKRWGKDLPRPTAPDLYRRRASAARVFAP